ncbi:hypothetical protein KCU65_g2775, partial [Aureobasidium melanogenum]
LNRRTQELSSRVFQALSLRIWQAVLIKNIWATFAIGKNVFVDQANYPPYVCSGYAKLERSANLMISGFYIDRYPGRSDARIITDNETGTWTMWICYGKGHLHHFNSPRYMHSEQAALDYALDLMREDARGNICLDHETVDSDDSDEGSEEGPDEDDDERYDEDDDEDVEALEECEDDDSLHDSDPDDPEDHGEYGEASFSDDEEDFDERNNHGNPYHWEESDDSGFSNGAGQLGSYGYYW